MTSDSATSAVLLYDGECGLCAGSVQFVLAREGRHLSAPLRFAPLQGEVGASALRQHPELAAIDSVVWFEPFALGGSRVLVRGDAVLAILAYLGGPWRLLSVLGRVVPAVLRDAMYDAIAKRRMSLVNPACLLPTADQRHRFLP